MEHHQPFLRAAKCLGLPAREMASSVGRELKWQEEKAPGQDQNGMRPPWLSSQSHVTAAGGVQARLQPRPLVPFPVPKPEQMATQRREQRLHCGGRSPGRTRAGVEERPSLGQVPPKAYKDGARAAIQKGPTLDLFGLQQNIFRAIITTERKFNPVT